MILDLVSTSVMNERPDAHAAAAVTSLQGQGPMK